MSALDRHEEFEQLLRGMRNRLIAVSEEVSRTVTKANWHAETAPAHVRTRVQASIADITNTQDWLQTRLAQLPDEAQARYAAMQEMLQVQFVAVQKVTTILDELLALRNKPVAPEYLPSEMRPPQPEPRALAGGYPSANLGPLDPGTPIARDFAPALATPTSAPLFDAPTSLQPLFPLDPPPRPQAPAYAQPQPSLSFPMPTQLHPSSPQQSMEPQWEHQWDHQRDASRDPNWDPPREPQWGQMPSAFAPQTATPGAVHLSDLEPTLAPPMGPGEMPRAFTQRPPEAKAKAPQKGARKYQRPAPRSRMGLVTIGLVAAIVVVGVGGWLLWGAVAGGTKPQRVAIGDPTARKGTAAGPSTAPVRSVDPIVARVPQAPPMSAPPLGDDFVPVIATHREKDGLTSIFMELRKQYPGIVATRKAIAQTVNLGSDGVWYQLVLLPPGPREQAEAICEELRRAGYPRCAVRPNKP